jgi:hypothetical protein
MHGDGSQSGHELFALCNHNDEGFYRIINVHPAIMK